MKSLNLKTSKTFGKKWEYETDMDDALIEGWAIHTKLGKTQFIGTPSETIVFARAARMASKSIDWIRPYRTTDDAVIFRV